MVDLPESTIDRLKAEKRSKGGGEREPHPSQPNEILKIQEMTFVTICILSSFRESNKNAPGSFIPYFQDTILTQC